MGYYEFGQVNGVAPTEKELQSWMNRHKLQLPSVAFVQAKRAELQKALNATPITTNSSKSQRANRESEIANFIHTQDMLSRAVLPSHEFVEFLKLREKFPERVNMAIGCWVAYKILKDPSGRVYVSRILAISHDSIQFEHREPVKINQLLPVIEEQSIDEDTFGNWLEDIDDRNEQLPHMSKTCEKRSLTLDIIRRTLQQGPPIESESRPITWKDLVIRPEDIGVLLTGLDQQEFRQVLSGMFVCFDFGSGKGPNTSGIYFHSNSEKREFWMKGHWALPIADITFEPDVTQHSLPFLPPHLRSNALLRVDSQLALFVNVARIVAFPIPQTRELIRRDFSWDKMSQLNCRPPSHEFVKSKVQQFWQALEKAKRVPFNPHQTSVLPVQKLPKQESPQIFQ